MASSGTGAIAVRFSVNYVATLSPEPVEFDPELHVYLSVQRSEPRLTRLQFDAPGSTAHAPRDAHHYTTARGGGGGGGGGGSDTIPSAWYAHENVRGPLEFAVHEARLTRDVTLNVDAFAHTYNSKGTLCRSEAGSCSLYVKDVYDEFAQQGGDSDQHRRLVVQKVLKVHNAGSIVKGAVVFVFERDFVTPSGGGDLLVERALAVVGVARTLGERTRALVDNERADHIEAAAYAWRHSALAEGAVREHVVGTLGTTREERLRVAAALVEGAGATVQPPQLPPRDSVFAPASTLDYRGENKRLYEACFKRYILANYEVFAAGNAAPTWPFMRNIHSPMYRYRGITVPGLCFTLLNNARAANTERYYVNLLHITLRRHYGDAPPAASGEQLAQRFVDTATDAEVAVVLAKLACVFSNYCTYMTDKAHTLADAHTAATRASVGSADKLAFVGADVIGGGDSGGGSCNSVACGAALPAEVDTAPPAGLDGTEAYTDPEYYEALRRISSAMPARGGAAQRWRHAAEITVRRAARLNAPANVRLIESFSVWLRATFTGDCEDMAREILRHLWDMHKCTFAHPALRKLQRVRRRYVALQTLKGVTSAALTDNLDQVSDMGAHMDITLVHAPYLLQLMRAFNSHEPLLDELDEVYGSDAGTALPTLVCEGTGCLQPDGAPDASAIERMYVMSTPRRAAAMRAFANVKSMLHQPLATSSSFYKTVQSALVHDFIAAGYPIGEIVFFRRGAADRHVASELPSCNVAGTDDDDDDDNDDDDDDDDDDEDASGHVHMAGAAEQFSGSAELHHVTPPPIGVAVAHMGRPTYGIEHTKLIGRDTSDTMVYTMPDLRLDELRRFERVLRQNHPVLPLDAPVAGGDNAERVGNAHLELVCAAARANARRAPANAARQHATIDWYFSYAQVTAERARALCDVIASRPHIIRADYYDEPVCDDGDGAVFGGYLVRLTCHRLRMVQ